MAIEVSLEKEFILNKIISFIQKIREKYDPKLLTLDSRKYTRDVESIIDILNKTTLSKSFWERYECLDQDLIFNDRFLNLVRKGIIFEKSPLDIENGLNEIFDYFTKATRLIELSNKEIVKVVNKQYRNLVEIESLESDKERDVDLEEICTPVIEGLSRDIKKIRNPIEILSKLGNLDLFGNKVLVMNRDKENQYYAIEELYELKDETHVPALNKEQVISLSEYMVRLLKSADTFNNFIITTAKPFEQLEEVARNLDILLDTGLHDETEYILSRMSEVHYISKFTIDFNPDVLDIVESLIFWIKESVREKR